jgi:predicted MFS family arabinose efflux permease
MDRHDQNLLDKQMRRVTPTPRNNGTMILAIVAVFLTGMTVGGFMTAYQIERVRTASNDDATVAISLPSSALPIAR